MNITVADHSFSHKIYESSLSLVYRGYRTCDERPVVLKILKQEYPSRKKIAQFQNEYNLLKDLDIAGVRRAYRTTKVDGKYALLLEYIPGDTLRKIFITRRKTIKEL